VGVAETLPDLTHNFLTKGDGTRSHAYLQGKKRDPDFFFHGAGGGRFSARQARDRRRSDGTKNRTELQEIP
jgi:hypothetical protein